MRLLGIDFGSKRVGIAIGDSESGVAVPKGVYPNNKFLFGEIKDMVAANSIERIIMGESRDSDMRENKIMESARSFAALLKSEGIDVDYEPEFMTSQQARRIQGETPFEDASAAAIILQSYLDKSKN